MANFTIHDPSTDVVQNRVLEYRISVNTPTDTVNFSRNPDISAVTGVPVYYWILGGTHIEVIKGEDVTVQEIDEMDSAQKAIIDEFLWPTYPPTDLEYWRQNPQVTDAVSGVTGEFSTMQTLVNRRELFNDTENPVYKAGHIPLLGSTGSVTNLNTIHGKLGWHGQQVAAALYQRPKDLLIYYGWPNAFNSGANGWDNEKVAQDMAKYSLVILGNGVADPAHGDYSNTQAIIPRVQALNPSTKIYGYVTVNQVEVDFQADVDDWDDLGVDGIFLDEAGYDYGTPATNGRAAFNSKVDFVHAQSSASLCFANSWNMDHVIGLVDDGSYPNATWNPGEVASNLTENDWYLLESFPVNEAAYTASAPDGYEPVADWATRGVKAQGHRANYGINLAAVGIISNTNPKEQELFDFLYVSALLWSLDAVGSSDLLYGASSAAVEYHARPDVSQMGPLYSLNTAVQVDTGDSNVYWRYTDHGRFKLDFTGSNGQEAAIEKR